MEFQPALKLLAGKGRSPSLGQFRCIGLPNFLALKHLRILEHSSLEFYFDTPIRGMIGRSVIGVDLKDATSDLSASGAIPLENNPIPFGERQLKIHDEPFTLFTYDTSGQHTALRATLARHQSLVVAAFDPTLVTTY